MNGINRGKIISVALILVFIAGSLSGCTSLRRKFVRKAKVKDMSNDIMPVLEPVEYAPVQHSPVAEYKMHYNMFQGYFQDVWDTLGRGDNEKRERYLLTQMASHLDVMSADLNDVSGAKLKQLSERITMVLKELDKPRGVRRYDGIRLEIKAVERAVRVSFKPAAVQAALKK